MVKQFQSITEVAGGGKSAEIEQAAGGVDVADAGGDDHLGVDLLDLVHRFAFVRC